MTKIFNKLVRDNIPEIIEKNNEVAVTKILNEQESLAELIKKLKEESDEVALSKTENNVLEELADVFEVICAMAKFYDKGIEDIKTLAYNKKLNRGGFEGRIFLEKTYSKTEREN